VKVKGAASQHLTFKIKDLRLGDRQRFGNVCVCYKRILRGLKSLRGLKIPKDILVYTKTEFEEMAKHRASLCYKIKHEGIKAYEAA
jgi:hypothetical protein